VTKRRASYWARFKKTSTNMLREGRNNFKSSFKRLRRSLRKLSRSKREETVSIKRILAKKETSSR
jgi:hypothetical protein